MKFLFALVIAIISLVILFLGIFDGEIGMIFGGLLGFIFVPILLKSFTKEMQKNQEQLAQNLKVKSLEELEDWYTKEKNQKLSKELKENLEYVKDRAIKKINDFKVGDGWKPSMELELQISIFESSKLKNQIISFLKKEKTKLPASDIDFQLKIGDLDRVKKACEELYRDKEIGRTGNYRYFV
tara:strand:- start:90 stop:638 length:549 start_codon:yes stop_codon:yes gene_type:complete